MRDELLRPMRGTGAPHVIVLGSGIVGLSTAWFLQEWDAEVTVVERAAVAAGSSWGNAGWISPGLAAPLSEPAVLKYGLKSLRDPDSPLHIPFKPRVRLARFLLGFARRCTTRQWMEAMKALVPVNRQAIEAYEQLEAGGVKASTREAPIIAAFRRAADAAALRHEVELIGKAGLDLDATEADTSMLRTRLPVVSPDVETAIRIGGQRHLNPGEFVSALADAVQDRGGRLVTGAHARALRHGSGGVMVEIPGREPVSGDAAVIAIGAWLPELARACGVRKLMWAGRGYSFSVPVTDPAAAPVPCPIYFPVERIACTPLGERLRIGGTMELAGIEDPFRSERVAAIVNGGRALLTGVDWDDQQDQWVGSRPVTVDSLPLIGETKMPRVFVNGGHGMWGMTLGPVSGRLLAEQMITGRSPRELLPFNPIR
jgi:D-amino-acid dehydrogenase